MVWPLVIRSLTWLHWPMRACCKAWPCVPACSHSMPSSMISLRGSAATPTFTPRSTIHDARNAGALARPDNPLAYLEHANNRARGTLDIHLRVGIESAARRAAGVGQAIVSQTTFKHQYWTIAQMLTQHTVGGCNMQSGDLLGSGTISGPTAAEAGALLELTLGGKQPMTLSGPGAPDEQRGFLADGDAVVFEAWCEKPGCARIGFGENRGLVLPAHRSSERTST